MKNTPMQEVTEYCELRMSELNQSNTVENVCRMAFYDVVAHIEAEQLLELEKKQIIDAYRKGVYNSIRMEANFAEDYYNQTFNK